MDDPDFLILIRRAQDGDGEAIREIVEKYENEIRVVIRARLPLRLRSRFDSMDFVQDVWNSFLVGDADGRVAFENSRHLRGYLIGIAENKVNQQFRRRTRTLKYAISREQPLTVRRGPREVTVDLPSSDPSPSQTLQADDRFEKLLAGRNGIEKEIVRLRCDGLTQNEIASKVGRDVRTVRRILDDLHSRWEAQS